MIDHETQQQQAERLLAEQGLVLTAEDRAAILALQQAEIERIRALQATQNGAGGKGLAARINRAYPAFLRAIESAGNAVITALYQFLHSAGALVITFGVLIVEQQRVQAGMSTFEVHIFLASLGAVIAVLGQFIGEIMVHHAEHKAGYVPELATRASLRKSWQRLAYWLGFRANWQPEQLSPAARFRAVLKINTAAILVLAVLGSMKPVIDKQNGAWHEALIKVVRDSDLPTMISWAGGLIFAVAIVALAQALSRHISVISVEVLTAQESKAQQAGQADQSVLDRIAVDFMTAKIKRHRRSERRGRVPDVFQRQTGAVPGVLQDDTVDVTPPIELVRAWFAAPDNAGYIAALDSGQLSLRQAGGLIGVSHTTVSRFLKEREKVANNGHIEEVKA